MDTKQLQKQEAIKRLKILQDKFGLMKTVTKEFEKEDTLYYSEYFNRNMQGILYWVSNKKSLSKIVKEFEEKHKALVYHAILVPTVFGNTFNLLYVTEDKKE